MEVINMKNKLTNAYDDDNIPEIDIPAGAIRPIMAENSNNPYENKTSKYDEEPLPESFRPRQDGPGGN